MAKLMSELLSGLITKVVWSASYETRLV